MAGLTLDEKIAGAEHHARETVIEQHFFDTAQPHFPLGFSVSYRNPGHWDVYADQTPGKASALRCADSGAINNIWDGVRERAFRIRGAPGNVVVLDERWNPYWPHPREPMRFRSIMGAMLWIAEELMQEPSA